MESLTVHCPSCRAKVRVRTDRAGKKVKCPKCNALFALPDDDPASSVMDVLNEPLPMRFDEPVDMPDDAPPKPAARPTPVKTVAPTRRPFPFLRFLAAVYLMAGIAWGVLAVLWVKYPPEPIGVMETVLILIAGGQLFVFSCAIAEGIRLALSVEENGRRSTELLEALLRQQAGH